MDIETRDIIAVILLTGLFWLKYLGMNGTITAMILMVVTYYFSKRIHEEKYIKGK